MKIARKGKLAALAAAFGLIAAGALAPAEAATRSTVVLVTSNAMTSLNSGKPETNLTVNGDIAYLQGSGFLYYDDNRNLIRNTIFGKYEITKNTAKDFRVTYTVNKGRVWSDGTPIDGVDLLMSHVLSSDAYSKAAGLGDPASEAGAAFDSLGYGGTYSNNVVGNPILSKDKMSVTIRYSKPVSDWEILGPGPSPVHALVHMADGKKALQAAAANTAAKAKFLKIFTSRNTAELKKIAEIWNKSYDITTVDASTNPLLLVANGGYQVKSAVTNQSVTLTVNPKYNSGPKLNNVKTIVFRFIADGTAAAQALANKEIDIYQGQPTADAVAQLKAMNGVSVIGGVNACFEHVDVRQGAGPDEETDYTGPFATSNNAAKNAKARDLRTAFLLAFPRQEILDKLVKPINPKAQLVNSAFLLPGQKGYAESVKASGVSKFTAGTQADRTAQALALVKKHFPDASATNPAVTVNLLWGTPTNQRRASEAQLIIAEAAKAGFKVVAPGDAGWGGKLASNAFDAAFFAWCPTSTAVTGTNANFLSDGSNNYIGYNNAAMDEVLRSLEGFLPQAEVLKKYAAADKLLVNDAVTLGIFQHPAVTGHNSALKNVKPAPLSPNLVWNYWEWKY